MAVTVPTQSGLPPWGFRLRKPILMLFSTAIHIGFPSMTQPQTPPADASPLSRVEQAVGEFREAASRVQSVLKALTDDERRELMQNHNMFDTLVFAARDVRDTADQMDQAAEGR